MKAHWMMSSRLDSAMMFCGFPPSIDRPIEISGVKPNGKTYRMNGVGTLMTSDPTFTVFSRCIAMPEGDLNLNLQNGQDRTLAQ